MHDRREANQRRPAKHSPHRWYMGWAVGASAHMPGGSTYRKLPVEAIDEEAGEEVALWPEALPPPDCVSVLQHPGK